MIIHLRVEHSGVSTTFMSEFNAVSIFHDQCSSVLRFIDSYIRLVKYPTKVSTVTAAFSNQAD
jgi:hypothetical protein